MNIIKRESGEFGNNDPFFNDRFFSGFLPSSLVRSAAEREMSIPRIDIIEKESSYVVTADLPGVAKEDIELTLDQGVLTLATNVERENKEEKEGQLIRSERYSGHYLRRLDLGSNVANDSVEANFDNGVLKINIPKVEMKVPKSIKVEVS